MRRDVCGPWLRQGSGRSPYWRSAVCVRQGCLTHVVHISQHDQSGRLVDIKVLKSGARNNHVLGGSEGYQSEAIIACFLVQTVFTDCWAKNTFSPHFRVKIANQNLYIGSGASVIQKFEFVVKGILGCVILILRKASVKLFCLNADGG